MKDLALERIWKARDAIAKRAGYDAKTLVAQLKETEAKTTLQEKSDALTVVREPGADYGER